MGRDTVRRDINEIMFKMALNSIQSIYQPEVKKASDTENLLNSKKFQTRSAYANSAG